MNALKICADFDFIAVQQVSKFVPTIVPKFTRHYPLLPEFKGGKKRTYGTISFRSRPMRQQAQFFQGKFEFFPVTTRLHNALGLLRIATNLPQVLDSSRCELITGHLIC